MLLFTDPVPYLDILGVAEGSILLICASLPTLGPLVRLVRDQVTTHRSSRQQSNKSEGSSRVIGGQWSGYKGQKLDDGEHTSINDRSINGMLSSVDDIPLVSKSEDMDVETGNIVGNTKSEHVQGLPKSTRM